MFAHLPPTAHPERNCQTHPCDFDEANLSYNTMVTEMLKRPPCPSSNVVQLPLNIHGRDFGCGDIHGAYDLVIQGMRLAHLVVADSPRCAKGYSQLNPQATPRYPD